VQRAAAEVKVREERKRRRLAVALAAAVLVLALIGGAAAWGLAHWRIATDARLQAALQDAIDRRAQAQAAPAGDTALSLWADAEAAGRRLDDLVNQGFPSAQMRQVVADFNSGLAADSAAARRTAEEDKAGRTLLGALANVRLDALANATSLRWAVYETRNADADYQAAFRHFGVDVDALTTEAAAARFASRSPEFRVELAAALDDWALERRSRKGPASDWQRLVALARALDREAGTPKAARPRRCGSRG